MTAYVKTKESPKGQAVDRPTIEICLRLMSKLVSDQPFNDSERKDYALLKLSGENPIYEEIAAKMLESTTKQEWPATEKYISAAYSSLLKFHDPIRARKISKSAERSYLDLMRYTKKYYPISRKFTFNGIKNSIAELNGYIDDVASEACIKKAKRAYSAWSK